MKKIVTYSTSGTKLQPTSFPKDWIIDENLKLLAQAIRVYKNNQHTGNSKTKTRGEIKLTTKKAYRQKGTGMARHGAKSAPIFVGGSKAHGPKGIKRVLKLPSKMRKKAKLIALNLKANKNNLFFVDKLDNLDKTKKTHIFISKLIKLQKFNLKSPRFTFLLSVKNKNAEKFIRNLPSAKAILYKDANAYSIFFGGIILIDKKVLNKNKK